MRGDSTGGQRSAAAWGCVVLVVLLVVPAPAGAADRTKVFRGLNVPGVTAGGCALGAPPDPTGAIGPRHYVAVANSCITVYDRGLGRVAEMPSDAFWGRGDTFDPQAVWDPDARRWYFVMLSNPFSATPDYNSLLFAWTKTADPTDLADGWCSFAIPTGTFIDDFPNLGFSRRHIIIGTNSADVSTLDPETRQAEGFARVWAIAKPRDGDTSCGSPHRAAFGTADAPLRQGDGRQAATPVPVNPVRPSRGGYVIATDCLDREQGEEPEGEEGCRRPGERGDEITVWRLQGARGSPRLVKEGAIDVPAYRLPDNVPQPGTELTLDPADTRLTQAVSNRDPTRGDRRLVWTQHAVRGKQGRAKVRWYELDLRRLSVVRHGSISKPRNWVWNAAVSPTSRGNGAVINYNVAGESLLPQIRASSRGPGDPRHAMGGEITLGESVAPERGCDPPPEDPFCRWGDYAGATPDPRRRNLVWGSNQLNGLEDPDLGEESPHWGTRNFALARRHGRRRR